MTATDEGLPLGRPTTWPAQYDPSLLRPLARAEGRASWHAPGESLPFRGEDGWTCYELSWLGAGGVPRVAVASLRVPCDSSAIVESKSLKLYLNSYSQHIVNSPEKVRESIGRDVAGVVGCEVAVELFDVDSPPAAGRMPGECLDALAPAATVYRRDPELIEVTGEDGGDQVHTHLFRSVCPITGQPDWGAIGIDYEGRRICRDSLLAYLVSYRLSPGFHEDAVERIFVDLLEAAAPERLTVLGRFLRRGGIDINPFRSTHEATAPGGRLARQ